ncbi:MAG TPA: FMN-binding negative transcriptional regulator [Noviherbaspirillum sp.]|nr:FMN-binding negative transcriptional regulator [Noviherbaspirillum sp.]
MYVPSHFEELRPEVMHELIRRHPLGTLVTLGENGLNANHIPFEIDPDPAPFGTLRAHVARNNPVWREHAKVMETLVVFQGAHTYISPSWYATKQEDSRVVPTYNYMAVHAYGSLHIVEDRDWLRALLERLTNANEVVAQGVGGAGLWRISDAPEAYIEKMLAAIVGIEIPVSRLIGKWKVSQNQSQGNRASVERALRAKGEGNVTEMADAVARK